MNESINKLKSWIFLNSDVKYIVADTLKTNIISQKLLKKIRMEFYKEDNEYFWWRLKNGVGIVE